MKQAIRFASAALLASALLVPAASAKDDVDPAAREWTQARGNSSRSGGSAVEPLQTDPTTAWEQKLPGPVMGEPVTWGGTVFVAAGNERSRKLLAFRVTTGEPLGSQDLGGGGRLALASWQGVVMVGEPKQIRAFRHDGTKFGSGWSKTGAFGGPPCVYRGYCIVSDGDEIACFDIVGGGAKTAKGPAVSTKELATYDETRNLGKDAKPIGGAVGVFRNAAGEIHLVNVASVGSQVLLSHSRIEDLGVSGKMKISWTTTESPLGALAGPVTEADRWDMVPCRLEGDTPRAGAWLVLAPRPFTSGGTGRIVPDAGKPAGLNLVTTPAVCEGTAFSFNQQNDLKTYRADGKTETLVQAGNSPPGTKPGPATRAGGVVFLGNWAVDVAGRRVIWNLKQDPSTPAIPVGDKRLVFGAKEDLVCVADPSLAAQTAVTTAGADPTVPGAATTAPAPAPTAPKEPGDLADGVLLDDGRQIEGTFERTSPVRIAIHPKDGGEAIEVWTTQIVVGMKAGEIDKKGDDAAALRVWKAALQGAYCDTMEGLFREYVKASLIEDARRAMQSMREAGAGEGRLQKLDASLNGKAQRTDAARQKKLLAQEAAARAAECEGFFRASDWCAKHGFNTAGTVALIEVGKLKGDPRAADLVARAKALIPAGLPSKDAPDAAASWMTWASALLPSSAEFIEKDDSSMSMLENAPWDDGATLAFRTRNVLMFIRDREPAVCGKALQLAEGTVRALQVFLNDGAPDAVSNDRERLEIRIHRDRKDYLSESSSTGKAPEWSAGNFSPSEKVSRFYVERGSTRDGSVDVPELTRVLTHEFTHHYMHVRWLSADRKASGSGHWGGGGRGYWVVEGMAEFVQNQAQQMDRRGLKFDDDTVPGVDGTAQGAKVGVLFPAARFVDMSSDDFAKLGNDFGFLHVKLRNSFKEESFSERALWYAQAGALTYFFLQKKGPDVRKNFVSYVRQHYLGSAPTPGWQSLGYESAEDLDKEFTAFLKKVGG